MPLFEATNPQNNQTEKPLENKVQEESGLIKTIGQLLPLAPFVFEQFTGQKVPPMRGTMAEIHLALTNLQTNLQAVVNNQQQLMQRLANLETSASQQLNNLTNQFQSFRLTHAREKKEIQYNPNRLSEENPEESY